MVQEEGKAASEVPETGNSHLSHWNQVQLICLAIGEDVWLKSWWQVALGGGHQDV